MKKVLLACILLAGCTQVRVTPTIHVPIGATCVVKSDGLECTPEAPPPVATYTITVTKTGSGNGAVSVSPQGAHPAGTSMSLTASPDANSTFDGWSSGCSSSMTMPSQNITCTATFTAKAPPGPSGGSGVWSTRSQATGVYNWYYNLGAACPNGDLWIAWNGVTNRMPRGATSWTTETTTNSMGWRENFATACDENNIVHISPGTSGPADWSSSVDYNLATRTYSKPGYGGCNAHAAMGYDFSRKRLLTWGGWSTNCALLARGISGDWAPLNPSGPQPPLTQEYARETSRRGGVTAAGDAWVLADGNELYVYTATTNSWALVPTTGNKPPGYAIAALHEDSKTLVVVTGCQGMNDGDCGTYDGNTYLLDMTSKAWRLGTSNPEGMPMAKRHLLYSAIDKKVVYLTASYAPVNGRLGTNVYEWTPTGGTPPPSKVSLTTVANGNGTVTGGGSYDPGAIVTLSASPASGNNFTGWSPAPCAPSFAMPGSPLTCTGTFTAVTPPPTGTCTPKTREWVKCVTPTSGNPFPNDPAGSKDINWAWDGHRLIMGAGDIRSSGVADLYALNLPQGTWDAVTVGCRPTGEVMMNHPSDRGPMIVDKRGELWNWNGVPYPNQEGQTCGATGAIQKAGLLKRSPAGTWTQVTANKTASLGGGAYDTVADSMLHFEPGGPCSGNPGTLKRTSLASLEQESFPLCIGVTWTGSTGGWVAPEQPERVFFAWDDIDRKAYVIAPRVRYDAPGYVIDRVASLSVWDALTGTWTQKATAPTGSWGLVSYHTAAVWDSVSRRVIYPVIDNPCGEVRVLLAYDPDNDTWESFTVPTDVHGSTVAYDPRANAVVVGGSVFCSDYSQHAVYLWRYSDAPTRRRR